MTKKMAWRDALDQLERGEPQVLANTFSFPLPDKSEEQTELLRRLVPLLTVAAAAKSRPKATLVLGMLLQKIGAKPEAEAALVGLYDMDAKGDARLVAMQDRAAAGLLAIGSKSALRTLSKRLDTVLATYDEVAAARQFVDWKYPIDALARESTDLLATAQEHADPKRMAKPLRRQLALELLWKAWNAKTRSPKDDGAWASFLVSLWGGPFSQYARDYLLQLPESLVVPQLRKKLGPPRVAKSPPPAPKWLARYQKGEHQAVWEEMRALGSNAFDVPEVELVARETMKRVNQEIERIGVVLTRGRYRFFAKKKWHVPPTAKTAADVAKLEKTLGLRLPVSLRAFLEVVGSVDLSEVHTGDAYDPRAAEALGPFAGLGRLDPLEVIPPKEMLDVSKPYVVRETKKGPPELSPVGVVLFGYSPVCKHTGDDPDPMYRVELRFFGADAPVLQAGGPSVPFVDYLRETIGAGGFRQLSGNMTPREKRQRDALAKGAIAFLIDEPGRFSPPERPPS